MLQIDNGATSMEYRDSENVSKDALKIALQAMKKRCEYLTERLNAIEDENFKLKTKINKLENLTTTRNDKYKDISEFNDIGNSRVFDPYRLLETNLNTLLNENQFIWSRLSEMTTSSDKLSFDKQNDVENDVSGVDTLSVKKLAHSSSSDNFNYSLEEDSTKKHSTAIPTNLNERDEEIFNSLMTLSKTIGTLQQELISQRNKLKSVLEIAKKQKDEERDGSKSHVDSQSSPDDTQRICPLCRLNFVTSNDHEFDDFVKHVKKHFSVSKSWKE